MRLNSTVWNIPAGLTAAQRNGLRYEERAQQHLMSLLGEAYCRSPWLRFIEESEFASEKRACVPDGLLLRPPLAFVFEIKLNHTTDAWFQLRKLYWPVVRALPDIQTVMLIEVCSHFDPAVEFPEPLERLSDLKSFVARGEIGFSFGVYSWTP